jgi:protein SCO1/2
VRAWAGVAAVTLALGMASEGAPGPLPRLGPAPNFALTTQLNDRLWLTQLRGRLVVLTFFCARCESCPGLLPSLLDLSRALPEPVRRRVVFVAVSVDPGQDTWTVLRRFAREQRADPQTWVFLTSDRPAEIDVVARWYGAGVERRLDHVRHACRVALIDRAGQLRARIDDAEPGRLRSDLEALVAETP